jgi:hypothetical protein
MLLALTATLAVAGCAAQAENTQLAQADCKVAPITTTSVTGVRRSESSGLAMRQAEADLATSRYRARNLEVNYYNNNVEDALRACNNR